MSETLPPPLMNADCDLRSFKWFALDVAEITKGKWWLNATPSAKGVMITLLCEAWHQVPAGSLPSDRRSLARLGHIPAKVGRAMDEIMSEWVLCSDGRLYHPWLVKTALEALAECDFNKNKTASARAARAAKRGSVTEHTREDRDNTGYDITGKEIPF